HEIYPLSLHDALPISNRKDLGPDAVMPIVIEIDVPPHQTDPCNIEEDHSYADRASDHEVTSLPILMPQARDFVIGGAIGVTMILDRKSTRLNSSHVAT